MHQNDVGIQCSLVGPPNGMTETMFVRQAGTARGGCRTAGDAAAANSCSRYPTASESGILRGLHR